MVNGSVLQSNQYNSIFQLSSNGFFNVLGVMNQNLSNWIIYVEAFNTKIWGGDQQQYLIDLTLTAFVNNITYTLNKTSNTYQNLNVTIDLFKQNSGTLLLNIPAAIASDTKINFLKSENLPFLSLEVDSSKIKTFLVFDLSKIMTTGKF